jgi:hypothetical protein
MQVSYKVFTLFLVCLFYSKLSSAQLTSLDSFDFIGNNFDVQWKPKTLKLETNVAAFSNSLNVQMFNDVLFRPTFSDKGKERFAESQFNRLNFFAQYQVKGELKLNNKIGVYGQHFNTLVLNGNREFGQLALFGNASFQNQNVSAGKARILAAKNTIVGFSACLVESSKVRIKSSVGLNVLSSYFEVRANNASIFTANGGEYLDLSISNLEFSRQTGGVKGLGLDLGLDLNYMPTKKSNFRINAQNLNVVWLINQFSVDVDTSFRFDGFHATTIDEGRNILKTSDSTIQAYFDRNENKSNLLVLPSRISLSYIREMSASSKGFVDLEILDFGKVGVSALVGMDCVLKSKFALRSSIGYGTFCGLMWNEMLEFKIKGNSAFVNLSNLQSLAIPARTSSYGISLGYVVGFN